MDSHNLELLPEPGDEFAALLTASPRKSLPSSGSATKSGIRAPYVSCAWMVRAKSNIHCYLGSYSGTLAVPLHAFQ